MKVVYIIGPFRGANAWEIEQNIRRAEEAALKVWLTGKATAICPHTMNRFYQGTGPDEIWLKGDLELLSRADAALVVGDYEHSSGSKEEIALAETEVKIPVFHYYDGLPQTFLEWLDE